ncbi:MAG TPA: RNA 3'-terminal phosphate cyclase, partial [Armatimonadota bacterium]|nr:RNA 3'-terminal phosphate cyclase [Armatimonadota bacterium]
PLTFSTRGAALEIVATILTAELPDHVGARGAAAAARALGTLGLPGQVARRALPSNGPGAAVVVTVRGAGGHAGFSALGERGKPMERVVEEAFTDFQRWWQSGAAGDAHLADQLVLPAALAPGESRWTTPTVSEHLRTVLWVAAQFLPIRYAIEERDDGVAEVRMAR